MRCEEFEELAGAYAIGALPADELIEADHHLATCDKHQDVSELRAVAASLGRAVPEMDPPPALKTRLMDIVHAEARAERRASEPRQAGRGIFGAIRDWLRQPQTGYALAGAFAVVAIALLVWNFSLQSDNGGGPNDGTLVASMSGAGSGTFTYLPDEDVALMRIDGMAPAPAGNTYQLWVMRGGEAISLGLMNVNDAGTSYGFITNQRFFDDDQLAVTLEPAGGSLQPTTDPLVTGQL